MLFDLVSVFPESKTGTSKTICSSVLTLVMFSGVLTVFGISQVQAVERQINWKTNLLCRGFRLAMIVPLIAICVLATFASSPAEAQTPLTLTWKTKMKFGTVASDLSASGTVVIDASANSRSVIGGVFDMGGTWKRGKFQLIGEPKAKVIVTIPSSIVLQNNSGAFSITVTDIHMNKTNPITLSKQGKKNVFVGGTLQVTVNQKAKTYNDIGTFTIDGVYQ
jgi:hypothetical protein